MSTVGDFAFPHLPSCRSRGGAATAIAKRTIARSVSAATAQAPSAGRLRTATFPADSQDGGLGRPAASLALRWRDDAGRRISKAPRRPPNHATRQQSAVTLRAAFRPPLICGACSASWESGEASRCAGMLDRSFAARLGRGRSREGFCFALSLRCFANRSGLMACRIDLGDVGRRTPLIASIPILQGRGLLSVVL